MKNAITSLNGWITVFTGLLFQVLILGALLEVIFGLDVLTGGDPNKTGVMEGIGTTMAVIGKNGLGGLVALVLIATWYKKS